MKEQPNSRSPRSRLPPGSTQGTTRTHDRTRADSGTCARWQSRPERRGKPGWQTSPAACGPGPCSSRDMNRCRRPPGRWRHRSPRERQASRRPPAARSFRRRARPHRGEPPPPASSRPAPPPRQGPSPPVEPARRTGKRGSQEPRQELPFASRIAESNTAHRARMRGRIANVSVRPPPRAIGYEAIPTRHTRLTRKAATRRQSPAQQTVDDENRAGREHQAQDPGHEPWVEPRQEHLAECVEEVQAGRLVVEQVRVRHVAVANPKPGQRVHRCVEPRPEPQPRREQQSGGGDQRERRRRSQDPLQGYSRSSGGPIRTTRRRAPDSAARSGDRNVALAESRGATALAS